MVHRHLLSYRFRPRDCSNTVLFGESVPTLSGKVHWKTSQSRTLNSSRCQDDKALPNLLSQKAKICFVTDDWNVGVCISMSWQIIPKIKVAFVTEFGDFTLILYFWLLKGPHRANDSWRSSGCQCKINSSLHFSGWLVKHLDWAGGRGSGCEGRMTTKLKSFFSNSKPWPESRCSKIWGTVGVRKASLTTTLGTPEKPALPH